MVTNRNLAYVFLSRKSLQIYMNPTRTCKVSLKKHFLASSGMKGSELLSRILIHYFQEFFILV